MVHVANSAGNAGVFPRITEFTDPDACLLWEEAWCQDDRPRGLFLPGLLSESVVVLGRIANDRILAGGIVNRSADAAGISNVFSEAGSSSRDMVRPRKCARTFFPDLPLSLRLGRGSANAREQWAPSRYRLRVWLAGQPMAIDPEPAYGGTPRGLDVHRSPTRSCLRARQSLGSSAWEIRRTTRSPSREVRR